MEYIVFTFYSEIVLLVGIRGSKHRILRGQMGDPAVNFLSFNFFTFYDKGGMEIRLKGNGCENLSKLLFLTSL